MLAATDLAVPQELGEAKVDQPEFEQLAADEREGLVRFARGMLGDAHEAEDVAQESLMRLYRGWGGQRDPKAYLYRTSANLCLDQLRRRGRSLPPGKIEPGGPQPLEARERREAVRRALAGIAPRERAAVLLREVQGLSYRQIASTLEASVEQITNWIHRGKNRLRKLLAPYVTRGELR
jgi:RNA polymerase sigma-70 factor (ECF subfamily)